MQTYTLTRLNKDKNPTEGFVLVGDEQFHTLERPWLDNKPFVSCIPAGTYRVTRDLTGRFRYFRVQAVPGRSLIEIHPANMCEQLEGCIALGFGFAGDCLIKSKAACDRFLELVGDDGCYLDIVNAGD